METRTLTQDAQHTGINEGFWRFPDPVPKRLTVRGQAEAFALLESLPGRGLAVVGTRDPQPRSLEETRRVILALRGYPMTILSGLARGIDAEAHEAALAAGLPTIAVLAGGVENIFPSSNRPLARRILEHGGLLISEYEDHEPAYPGRFLDRNRLIAGLAAATWVVEAASRSGSLNTARWARSLGRTCFATPCLPGDTRRAGNQALIQDHGARPLWSAQDLASTADGSWLALANTSRAIADLTRLDADASAATCSDARILITRVADDYEIGVDDQALLDRQLSDGWTTGQYFRALDYAVRSGALSRRQGLLLKNAEQTL